ncbi:MAG: GspH/FimT family pseudopilin [Burkholderiaceae bacterium]|nr:GspH/FimT family pseudopilin [Burkholderiaceae bacterium]
MELMATLAVLAILLAVGIPSFSEFTVNYRTTAQANDLLADLAFARMESVKLGRTVEVSAEGGVWEDGWRVGVDLNTDGDIGDTGELLRQHGAAEQDFTIEALDGTGAAFTRTAFDGTGARTVPADANNAEVAICRPDGDEAKSRWVAIAATGRAEARKDVTGAAQVGC